MRRLKISFKKYFYFTLTCALLLLFGFNLKERELWKSKNVPSPSLIYFQQQQQQLHDEQLSNNIDHHFEIATEQKLHPGVLDRKQLQHPQFIYKKAEAGGQNQLTDNETQHQREHLADYHFSVMDPSLSSLLPSSGSTQSSHSLNHSSSSSVNLPSSAASPLSLLSSSNRLAVDSSEETRSPVIMLSANQNKAPLEYTPRAWFFKNGDLYPKPANGFKKRKSYKHKARLRGHKLFPHQDPYSDRIVRQLMYVPPNYTEIRASGKLKTILLFNGLGPWNVKPGRDVFRRSKCPVDTCQITAARDRSISADLILYKDHFIPTGVRSPTNPKQITMLYYLECPYHTQNVKVPDGINWTATYRRDSDIVAPYEKWQYYDNRVQQIEQDHNYAANKTKKVAWFVSNCGARNGRLQYAHELAKYIEVDIYGACGNYKCSRITADKCFEMLDRDYKFYLAFENSNCKDYITEKFFVNALNRNILPIVMGARPEDYELSAPHRSYIHVDEFASANELADYLHILDKNDKLYNSYFNWKGTGEFINTYYWCRLCAILHDEESLNLPRWYTDINDWWRGAGVCTNGSWRNFKARQDIISDD